MSIQEERELSERLGDLLGGIEPHVAPFESVVRQGRGIKYRRQAAVASGLAVIAAGAILGPTVLRSELAAPPAAAHTRHYTVTVSPPAKGAKPGVIATGSINGWHWQAILSGTGGTVSASFSKNFSVLNLGEYSMEAGTFASFDSEGNSGSADEAYVGPAAPSVRYFTMSLSNGQVLTLYPRSWMGHPYVAVVLPEALQVIEADAYGSHGEIGYAIPFNYQGSATISTWLRPNQAGLPRVTTRIGAGGSGRSRWVATAYVGPWGLCAYVSSADMGGGFCQAIGSLSPIRLVAGQFGSGPGGVEIGRARHDVAYLLVTRSDGSVARIQVVHVAGYPYGLTAVIRPGHPAFRSWVAYDAQGKRLGSGKGDPVGFK